MSEMVCIVCPRGCRLTVGDGPDFPVSGNGCARGAVYGRSEAEAPVRVVTATCRAAFSAGASANTAIPGGELLSSAELLSSCELPRRVPVRTTGGIPKNRVRELAAFLHGLTVPLPVRAGDVIIPDWEGTGVAITVTRDIG